MNERLLELRKKLKLSQESFGNRLGITKSSVSNMETGRFGVTDTMVKLICATFNVNEEWFRTGDGQMLIDSDASFAYFLGTLFREENSFKKRAITVLSKLTDDQWELIEKLVNEMSEK